MLQRGSCINPSETRAANVQNHRIAPLASRHGRCLRCSRSVHGVRSRAGDGAPLAWRRIQIWAHTTEGHERDPHSHGATITDANGIFRLEMPQIVPAFGQPHGHLAVDSGEFEAVFLRPVMRRPKDRSQETHVVLQPA
ncbi:twin-arginine translocation pathway signal [Aliiruegeria haliotis]|uniref:twin-arginine translocation pathway signal n=1 Tax=Aliiruegeria haliotis TaxID=1280846 RepID=UPI003CCC29B1